MELQTYRLPQCWQASFPASWEHEYDVQYGVNIFYPPDSDLTFRLTAFHAESHGIPAPSAIMETVLMQSVPENAQELSAEDFARDDCTVRLFRDQHEEDGKNVFAIYAGLCLDGDLMSVNLFGTDEQTVTEALAYLTLIVRRPPDEDET